MTVLTACQDAAKLLRPSQATPTSVFGTSDTFATELAALANESAAALRKVHDWRVLHVLKTQNGDGSATAFDLPSDYDRMPLKAAVFSTSHELPLEPINDLDEWLDRDLRSFVGSIGYWMLLSGQLQVKPAMTVTESVKFYYITKNVVIEEGGTFKEKFTADTDTFRLPERLLTLDLIVRWRHRKGLDYAQDNDNFEIAKAEEIVRDKGSRVLKIGRPRWPEGVTYAYPGTVSAG